MPRTNIPPVAEVVEYVNEHGLSAAAQLWGTSAPTLSRLLRESGYIARHTYRKVQKARMKRNVGKEIEEHG